jgi:hypothetical protein
MSEELLFQVMKMMIMIDFMLSRENPKGYPLYAVCEEPIDLRLRKESRKLDPQNNYEEFL